MDEKEVRVTQIWERHNLEGGAADRIVILAQIHPKVWSVTYGDMTLTAGMHEEYLRQEYRLMADYTERDIGTSP